MMAGRGPGTPVVAGGPAHHIPVLARPAVDCLAVRAGGVYLDATFGAGGYTRLILETAGLRVLSCSNPHDAHWMIQQAIETDDPVIFYEPKRRYWDKGEVGEAPDGPLGTARVLREGTDLTLLAYGPMVKTCLQAAQAAEEEGRYLEVVDLRSLAPLDTAAILGSVRRTGRAVVVHEASTFLGIGAELAAMVTEQAFYELEAPVLRVGGYNVPYPPSRLEEEFLPDVDRVLDAVDRSLAY